MRHRRRRGILTAWHDRLVAITREEFYMSVINTTSRPTRREIIGGVEPLAVAPAFFGPPVVFLLGPWLLLVLLLIGPAAVLIALILAFMVVAAALAGIAALLASPYLVVHHLRSRRPASRRRFAFGRFSSRRTSFASSALGRHLAAGG
jgi:hypothetical protein